MPPKEDKKAPAKGAPVADAGGGKQVKIFIHELDGYMGNVLGERAKRHAAEGEQPIICGSLIDPRNKPTWADEVVKADDVLGLKKALLGSDVIVYDCTASPKEATSALKILLKYDYAENPEDETEKVMIGVSSLLSWAGNSVPLSEEGAEGGPGGDLMQQLMTTANADERKAHPNYKAQVAVENLIIKKGNVRKDKLRTYIVWSGLLYGCGEGVMHSLFRCSWLGTHKVLPILGSGLNQVPMIHVSDLAGVVLAVAKQRPADFSTVLAVDRAESTIGDVVACISKALQSGEVKKVTTDEYLDFMTREGEPHIHSVLLSLNLKMQFDRCEAIGYGPESEAWVCGAGFVANIDQVVEEYRKWRNVQPVRVLFYGPPASGWYLEDGKKSFLAQSFADEYQVNYISLKDLVEEFKALPPFAEGGTDLATKLQEATAEGGEPDEELVIEVVQRKLQQPACRNQGFVLDNFPASREAAEALFDVDKVPVEGEVPPEEAPAEVTEGQEPPPKLAPLPQTVFALMAPQEFLAEKIAKIPEEEAQAAGETEEEFQTKFAAYEEANAPNEEGEPAGHIQLYRENKVKGCEQVVEIDVTYDLLFVQDKIRMSIGEPRNYDPNKARRERAEQLERERTAREEEEKERKRREEEASREEREAKAKLDAERLAKLQEEEQKSLLLRSQPMRRYLMDNVLPTLTTGLQEVAKVRPADPIDFLAEYLFNADPQLT